MSSKRNFVEEWKQYSKNAKKAFTSIEKVKKKSRQKGWNRQDPWEWVDRFFGSNYFLFNWKLSAWDGIIKYPFKQTNIEFNKKIGYLLRLKPKSKIKSEDEKRLIFFVTKIILFFV